MRGHGRCFIIKGCVIKADNLSGVAIICWTSCGWLLQPVWSQLPCNDIVKDCWVARGVWRRNSLCKGVSPCQGYVAGSAGSTAIIRLMLVHCKLRLMNLLICEMAHAALADDEAAHKAGASLSFSYASIINMIKHASFPSVWSRWSWNGRRPTEWGAWTCYSQALGKGSCQKAQSPTQPF